MKNLYKTLKRDYAIIDRWAIQQKGKIVVDFEDLINNPGLVVDGVNYAFDIKLSKNATSCVIDRGTDCYEGMLEAQFM